MLRARIDTESIKDTERRRLIARNETKWNVMERLGKENPKLTPARGLVAVRGGLTPFLGTSILAPLSGRTGAGSRHGTRRPVAPSVTFRRFSQDEPTMAKSKTVSKSTTKRKTTAVAGRMTSRATAIKPASANGNGRGAGRKQKMVYYFGGGRADGDGSMKPLLGGKGANLAQMTRIGLPVPPGFTITTEVCTAYYQNGKKLPPGLM